MKGRRLDGMLREVCEEDHIANIQAGRELLQSGWEDVWNIVLKRSASELMDPNCDTFTVRRRIEHLADVYRRSICDPVHLFASLTVQETVSQHVAALDRYCEENPVSLSHSSTASEPSLAWMIMLHHETIFTDSAPGITLPTTQLPFNLYASPHHGAESHEYLCPSSRRTLLYCALSETYRLLHGPGSEWMVSEDEWKEYRGHVWQMCKGFAWVDLDIVAHCFCGYKNDSTSFETYSTHREPLVRADRVVCKMMETLREDGVGVLRTWLQEVCKCPVHYLGIRFPPSFSQFVF